MPKAGQVRRRRAEGHDGEKDRNELHYSDCNVCRPMSP
jgi:hypothetical protein